VTYRYLKTRQVNQTLWAEVHIMILDYENATTNDIVDLLHTPLDVMENAKIFDRFEGK